MLRFFDNITSRIVLLTSVLLISATIDSALFFSAIKFIRHFTNMSLKSLISYVTEHKQSNEPK